MGGPPWRLPGPSRARGRSVRLSGWTVPALLRPRLARGDAAMAPGRAP